MKAICVEDRVGTVDALFVGVGAALRNQAPRRRARLGEACAQQQVHDTQAGGQLIFGHARLRRRRHGTAVATEQRARAVACAPAASTP